jgi:hypothetical protein
MDKPKAGLNQRIFAWAISRFAEKYKQRLFAGLSGTVLEIGPGTGVNLHYSERYRALDRRGAESIHGALSARRGWAAEHAG